MKFPTGPGVFEIGQTVKCFERLFGALVHMVKACKLTLPSLGGAGVWVLGSPLGLEGLLVWLPLVLRRRLRLWDRFQLWWLVISLLLRLGQSFRGERVFEGIRV